MFGFLNNAGLHQKVVGILLESETLKRTRIGVPAVTNVFVANQEVHLQLEVS